MHQFTSLTENIKNLLKQRQETVGVAESSTGGLVSAALLAIPGASAYFVGGGILYTHTARKRLLGIDLDNTPDLRASTEAYAQLVADRIRERLNTTWGVCETGAAGPSGNRYGNPAGHTCIAVSGPVNQSATLKTGLSNREENMWIFTEKVLQLFEQSLNTSK